MFDRKNLLVYAITDRTWLGNKTMAQAVEEAILGGASMIQYREKYLTGEALLIEAKSIQQVCQKYKVPLIINDYVELAKAIHADGVHVGQSDMAAKAAREALGPDKIVGVTAKSVEQAKLACAAGADYLGSGAVFGSTTKTDAKVMSHEVLQQICESTPLPVVAIGGITTDNVLTLQNRKIAGVSIISGIFAAKDITQATKDIRNKVEKIVML